MSDIVLSTLNAKYIHAAFGLRYLLANLGPLQTRACILEFDINQRPTDIAEVLLAQNPKVIGLGIYIWNVASATELVAALKRIRPDIRIVLGGPEVSYEIEAQPIVQLADHVITGEADLKFAEVCAQLLAGKSIPRIIPADVPELAKVVLPYSFYTDKDIAHRIIYVEASRGCPFTCEFCLSSLDIPVRQLPLDLFLFQLQGLLDRGARQLKFVDRTFNLNLSVSKAILEFLLARYQPGHFYHFEMIPDRLPDGLRDLIAKFPAGVLQFEVGVQTFDEKVGGLIKRRQNYDRLQQNFRFLRADTGVYIHADLIVGLPGETFESFGAGFDRLVALNPQEIQVGILKRLRGTPIVRHDTEWEMIYNPHPPYGILQNKLIDFATMQKLRRFARYWDLVGNSGNFVKTSRLLLEAATSSDPITRPNDSTKPSPSRSLSTSIGQDREQKVALISPFYSFFRFSEWLYGHVGRTDGIALVRLMEFLFNYLSQQLRLDPTLVANSLWEDYQAGGRRDKPAFLKDYIIEATCAPSHDRTIPALPKRQARHTAIQ